MKKKELGFLLQVAFLLLFMPTALLAKEPSQFVSRVEGHLLLEDYREAIREAERGQKLYPDSKEIQKALLKSYAHSGDHRKLQSLIHADLSDDELEEIAWGMIRSGRTSGSLPVQFYATLSAYFGRDIRGVKILQEALHSSNRMIRQLAVQMAGGMRDRILQEEVLDLLKKESDWQVRLSLLRAAGGMKIEEAKPLLEKVVESEKPTDEERAAALEGLVNLLEEPTREQIETLVKAPRAGLRMLACRLVDHFDLKEALDLLLPLQNDPQWQVRKEARVVSGWLAPRYEELPEEQHPEVAIAIAWVNARGGDFSGLHFWLGSSNKQLRQMAAAAICMTGETGLQEVASLLDHENEYIQLNAALTLLQHGKEKKRALPILRNALNSENRLMFEGDEPFSYVTKSTIPHITPQGETINQQIRLHLLDILAMLGDEDVEGAIRDFLASPHWGIPNRAAGALLQEGSEAARDAVFALLDDPSRKVRLQAALTLAMWGRDPRALTLLQKEYFKASRWEKERILEALGHIGDKSAIPFLRDSLKERFPQLRLIAAASLLQCLRS